VVLLSECMPTFRYTLVRGNETRTTCLRKSNPQGWLAGAVRATFPEVAARRAGDACCLRLDVVNDLMRTWCAVLSEHPHDLSIHVTQTRS